MITEGIETAVCKFEDFDYVRPDMAQLSAEFDRLFEAFSLAESYEQQQEILKTINELRAEFSSMYNICHIRHTIDTRDAFYDGENDFFNQAIPTFQSFETKLQVFVCVFNV